LPPIEFTSGKDIGDQLSSKKFGSNQGSPPESIGPGEPVVQGSDAVQKKPVVNPASACWP